MSTKKTYRYNTFQIKTYPIQNKWAQHISQTKQVDTKHITNKTSGHKTYHKQNKLAQNLSHTKKVGTKLIKWKNISTINDQINFEINF